MKRIGGREKNEAFKHPAEERMEVACLPTTKEGTRLGTRILARRTYRITKSQNSESAGICCLRAASKA